MKPVASWPPSFLMRISIRCQGIHPLDWPLSLRNRRSSGCYHPFCLAAMPRRIPDYPTGVFAGLIHFLLARPSLGTPSLAHAAWQPGLADALWSRCLAVDASTQRHRRQLRGASGCPAPIRVKPSARWRQPGGPRAPWRSALVTSFIDGLVIIFFGPRAIGRALVPFGTPIALGHPDNSIHANPLTTPAHIVPEWYFLALYAILRSIPNKHAGVAAVALVIVTLVLLGGR